MCVCVCVSLAVNVYCQFIYVACQKSNGDDCSEACCLVREDDCVWSTVSCFFLSGVVMQVNIETKD